MEWNGMFWEAIAGVCGALQECASASMATFDETGSSDAQNERSNWHPLPQHAARSSVKSYNPLTTPLPNAPRLRIYCAYGHGVRTERAYHYNHLSLPLNEGQCPAMELGTDLAGDQMSTGAHWYINRKVNEPARGLENGVQLGDGDGTVPLVSLGALCIQGWHTKELNPHGVKVPAPLLGGRSSIPHLLGLFSGCGRQ
jgi:hypothetical protein